MKCVNLLMMFLLVACTKSNNVVPRNDTKSDTIDFKSQIAEYKSLSLDLIKSNKNNASKNEIKSMASNLIEKAKPIMNLFSKKHPQCEKLMNAVINNSTAMTKLSLDVIETNFHQGNALPEAPDECYDAKELIVHPATVLVVINQAKAQLSKENREQIFNEIEEVVSHIDVL